MSASKHEMIMCIVNAGFSETVMEAAKSAGARGGTILNGRGTANKEAESFFHIAIQPEKEVVMILVDKEIKDAVLHALYQKAGLDTMGQDPQDARHREGLDFNTKIPIAKGECVFLCRIRCRRQ